MTCRAQAFARTMTGGAMPSMRVVVPRETTPKPYDLADWRREALEVTEVHEIPDTDILRAVFIGIAVWLVWCRIVYQMVMINVPLDLTVMGLA